MCSLSWASRPGGVHSFPGQTTAVVLQLECLPGSQTSDHWATRETLHLTCWPSDVLLTLYWVYIKPMEPCLNHCAQWVLFPTQKFYSLLVGPLATLFIRTGEGTVLFTNEPTMQQVILSYLVPVEHVKWLERII